MKIFKSIIILMCFICGIIELNAQQIPQFTQYILNPFILNPAFAGTTDHYDIKASFRKQWTNIDGSPTTEYVTIHGHFGKEDPRSKSRSKYAKTSHHGWGGTIMKDQTGIYNNFRINGSYAYDLKLTNNIRMSLGASVGLKSFSTDINRINLPDGTNNINTPLINVNSFTPDLSMGAYVYSSDFFVGISAQNLIFTSINGSVYNLSKEVYKNTNYYAQHVFIQGGYVFNINELFSVVPSALLKYAIGVPTPSIDLNAKVKYNNTVWGGVNYRTNDALCVFVGMLLDTRYEISYSYDYGISNISRYSGGSHELLVGYRIQPKFQVKSPSDYW